jgi:hypothetical protein
MPRRERVTKVFGDERLKAKPGGRHTSFVVAQFKLQTVLNRVAQRINAFSANIQDELVVLVSQLQRIVRSVWRGVCRGCGYSYRTQSDELNRTCQREAAA